MKMIKKYLILNVLFFLTGCNESNNCSLIALYGVSLNIFEIENTTKAPLCEIDYRVFNNSGFAHEGTTESTGNHCNNISFAEEVSGTFTIELSKDDYEDWQIDDIEVIQGRCHVVPVAVEAIMKPKT